MESGLVQDLELIADLASNCVQDIGLLGRFSADFPPHSIKASELPVIWKSNSNEFHEVSSCMDFETGRSGFARSCLGDAR